MNQKIITLQCSGQILQRLLAALDFYVESTFPPGSADCGQVAREELLNIVNHLRQQQKTGQPAGYSRRMRAMVKEGIRRYYDHLAQEDGRLRNHECELIQQASKGLEKSDDELERAQRLDQQSNQGSQGC